LEGALADFNKLLELKPGGFFATAARKEFDEKIIGLCPFTNTNYAKATARSVAGNLP
jgi:hypothetical protein